MFPNTKFEIAGEPRDMGGARQLAIKDRYQFSWWALSLINATPVGATSGNPKQGKKGADEGIDGWLAFASGVGGQFEKIIVQVKSGHVNVQVLREFRDVIVIGQYSSHLKNQPVRWLS
jgi:site-specific DNA-methyltransferase (adenine-specific)